MTLWAIYDNQSEGLVMRIDLPKIPVLFNQAAQAETCARRLNKSGPVTTVETVLRYRPIPLELSYKEQ